MIAAISLLLGGAPMRGVNPGQLAKASLELGETVLDPSAWVRVMERISEAVGATGAALLQGDVRTPDIPRTPSVDELMQNYFRQNWHVHDLRAMRCVPLVLGGASVITDQNIVTRDEMRWDTYYNECVKAMGFEWFAAVAFHAGDDLWALSIQRRPHEGPFEERDKKLLAPLARKLTEVASLSAAVGRIAVSGAVNALNAVRQPAIAIDRLGYVLDANPATEAIFNDGLRIRRRRLLVADPLAASMIDRLISRISATPDAALLSHDPIVVRTEGKPSTVIRVLPVHGAARTPFLGSRALLTFSPTDKSPALEPNLLAKMFDLTPAEAKLAVLAAQGKSPESIAQNFGISVVTARNQLKAVLFKTGSHRQAELVALLSKL